MIVVAGEALVDLIPTESGELSINPGGGPFNTARWLGRLGADVAFLGPIAADPLGQRLRDDLVAAGVALDLRRDDAATDDARAGPARRRRVGELQLLHRRPRSRPLARAGPGSCRPASTRSTSAVSG